MTNRVLYLLDVNVAANAGGNLGGVFSASQWQGGHPGSTWGIQVIDRAIALGLRLTTSQSFAATLEMTLRKENASDFDALDAESARATAAAFVALVRASNGIHVTNAESRPLIPTAKKAVSTHLHGNSKGQIDHEDFTIIASALASMRKDPTVKQVVIVTDDRGLANCARDLACLGIAVLQPAQFLALGASCFAAA